MAADIPPDLSHLAAPGAEIAVRVTPRASRARLALEAGVVRVWVTVPPEGGKANAEVIALLSQALGVPKTRLSLARGARGRDKLVRVEM